MMLRTTRQNPRRQRQSSIHIIVFFWVEATVSWTRPLGVVAWGWDCMSELACSYPKPRGSHREELQLRNRCAEHALLGCCGHRPHPIEPRATCWGGDVRLGVFRSTAYVLWECFASDHNGF